jgi:hypothetical protein
MPSPASDSHSVAGATTVVGGGDRDLPGTLGKDSTAHFDGFGSGNGTMLEGKLPGAKAREGKRSAAFVIAAEYMDESRPYFIKIGKDGVIPALQKLDAEMRNVRCHDYHLALD